MSCNKDDGCLEIVKQYKQASSDIGSISGKISSSIGEISNTLSSFDIPNDYIGQYVNSWRDKINNSLQEDVGNVTSIISGINGFISKKASEHKIHYNEWLYNQKKDNQKKDNQENDEDKVN